MKNDTIFRDKSIERISSPEQLNDYVKLTSPSLWFVILAIVVVLVGAIVFGVVGHIDSTVSSVTVPWEGKAVCLVKAEYGDRLSEDMIVKIDKEEYNATYDGSDPVMINNDLDSSVLFLGDVKQGDWVYEVNVEGDVPKGIHESKLVLERFSPISFIFGEQ